MRFSLGLSTGLGGRVRAGISRRGTPWVGARTGAGPAYLSVLEGGKSSTAPRRRRRARQPAAFKVYPQGHITVTLGGQTVEVTQAELRDVLAAAEKEEV